MNRNWSRALRIVVLGLLAAALIAAAAWYPFPRSEVEADLGLAALVGAGLCIAAILHQARGWSLDGYRWAAGLFAVSFALTLVGFAVPAGSLEAFWGRVSFALFAPILGAVAYGAVFGLRWVFGRPRSRP